jgi:hypothetical protein
MSELGRKPGFVYEHRNEQGISYEFPSELFDCEKLVFVGAIYESRTKDLGHAACTDAVENFILAQSTRIVQTAK